MRATLRLQRPLLAAALILAAAPVRADLIFLKDGFVLQGKLTEQGTEIFDPAAKEPIFIGKGIYVIDDGPRRAYFSATQVRLVESKPSPKEEVLLAEKPVKGILGAKLLPPIQAVVSASPFDSKWERIIRIRANDREANVPQRVGVLTPYFAGVDATRDFAWSSMYLTRELGAEEVLTLIRTYPRYLPKKGDEDSKNLDRQLKMCDFLVQAGYYDEAGSELERLGREMPKFAAKIATAQEGLDAIKAREGLEEIKRRLRAGQRDAARKLLESFPAKNTPATILAEVRSIKTDCEQIAERVKQLDAALAKLADELKEAKKDLMASAMEAIRSELHPDSSDRLEPFLSQAQQAARQKADGKKPELGAEQLAALAVTGWLQGGAAAEVKPESARRLWKGRQLVLDYQRADKLTKRQEVLNAYVKEMSDDALAPADLAQLIPNVPPPDAPEKTDAKPTDVTTAAGTTYALQLPPEYRPGRPYPVLLALAAAGEKPADMLKRWAPAAAEQGYIVAAPAWEVAAGPRGGYTFSAKEHQTVLEALYDLRRKYQVDSDRVFLFGLREGATAAFDIGLSHPDQFAGVVPMGAGPELFAERYFRNGQHLPFYVVNGDRTGDGNTKTQALFKKWTTRGKVSYPGLYIQYRGRGAEWFSGEVPNIFDWMREKRRAHPLRQLASDDDRTDLGNPLTSLRTTDNHFYWLSSDAISDRCTTTPERFSATTPAATFFGRVDSANNEITLTVSGLKQVTLWIARSPKGENLIDFDKPVLVRCNLSVLVPNKKLSPSLETLLEELYQHGDRQRLFLARLDFKL
jgi:pimeloyl-ACP methyl ester carboxylesterase